MSKFKNFSIVLYFFEDDENCSPQLLITLKEKFHRSNITQKEKIQILTLLPDKGPFKKIAREIGTSRYLIKKARILKNKCGIVSTSEKKVSVCFLEFHENF